MLVDTGGKSNLFAFVLICIVFSGGKEQFGPRFSILSKIMFLSRERPAPHPSEFSFLFPLEKETRSRCRFFPRNETCSSKSIEIDVFSPVAKYLYRLHGIDVVFLECWLSRSFWEAITYELKNI